MCLLCDLFGPPPGSIHAGSLAEAAQKASGIMIDVGGPSQRLTERPETAQDGQESPEEARPLSGLADVLKRFASAPPPPWTMERLAGLDMDAFKERLREETGLIERMGLPFSAPESGRTFATLAAAYIFSDLVPEWETQFERRNAEYGEYDNELGPLGETVEIIRKAKKLKRAFIDRVDTSEWDEDARQIAMDLIGHCFLLIMLLDEDGAGDRPE